MKTQFTKVEITKYAVYLVLNEDKSFYAFNIEKQYSKRLDKKVYVATWLREFETINEIKNYVLKNARKYIPVHDKRAIEIAESMGIL